MPNTLLEAPLSPHTGLEALPLRWVRYGSTRCQIWDGLHAGLAVMARTPHTIELQLRTGLHVVFTDARHGYVDVTVRGCHQPVGEMLEGRWYARRSASTVWFERADGRLVLRFEQPYMGRLRLDLSESGRTVWRSNLSW